MNCPSVRREGRICGMSVGPTCQRLASQGRAFGIAAVTSTSRSISPAMSPSRTQPSACRHSS